MQRVILGLALLALPALAAAPAFSATDTAAIYKAAGFAMKGRAIVGCDAADASWPRSDFAIEAVDLNGDGKPEALVNEGNTACYGNTDNGFTVVARDAGGVWRKLGGAVGMPVPLKTRHAGWLDIEVGGPGMGKMPVIRFDGKGYR